MQQMQPEAKILTWALATSKDEQNAAFIEISQKIAVEYPEIFAKFLEDFQKNPRKIRENSQDSRVIVTASDEENASIIAYHVRAGNPAAAIKEFQTWADCGTMAVKECIDQILNPKCEAPSVYLYWDKIKLILEYM